MINLKVFSLVSLGLLAVAILAAYGVASGWFQMEVLPIIIFAAGFGGCEIYRSLVRKRNRRPIPK